MKLEVGVMSEQTTVYTDGTTLSPQEVLMVAKQQAKVAVSEMLGHPSMLLEPLSTESLPLAKLFTALTQVLVLLFMSEFQTKTWQHYNSI